MAFPRTKLYFALLGAALVWQATASQTADTAPAPPDAAGQRKLLDAMGQFAEQYVSNLPNFICLQTTRQFEAGRKPNHWHKGDSLTSKLVFSHGHEQRTLQLVNDKPVEPGMKRWHTPLTTEGEFGILLGSVFDSTSNSSFAWNRWETLGGKRLAVFDYLVDAAHSTLRLSLSDLAQAVVPYRGSIYGDPATGAIRRITDSAFDIPPDVKTKSISTVIDYGEVAIGGVVYLLPIEASVFLTTDANNVRNDIQFTEYRKFEADSKITYAADGDGSKAPAGTSAPP